MKNLDDVFTAKRPPRVLARPDIDAWSDWEPINLKECCALFFPHGPLTVRSLRTAIRDGALGTTRIAGKIYTSKQAVLDMMKYSTKKNAAPPGPVDGSDPNASEPSGPCAHRVLGEDAQDLKRFLAEQRKRMRPRPGARDI